MFNTYLLIETVLNIWMSNELGHILIWEWGIPFILHSGHYEVI